MPPKPPEDKIELYKALLESHPEIEMKGKNMLYTSINGHMYSMMTKEGVLGMRLPAEEQAAFFEKYDSGPFSNYGAVIKDYVTIPDSLLGKTEELAGWLAKSYEYTLTLKPK